MLLQEIENRTLWKRCLGAIRSSPTAVTTEVFHSAGERHRSGQILIRLLHRQAKAGVVHTQRRKSAVPTLRRPDRAR